MANQLNVCSNDSDAMAGEGYKPSSNFEIDALKPLLDLNLKTDSTELWLIQWPINPGLQFPEIDGKEFTVKLNEDGKFGEVEDLSGKIYDLVSFQSQAADATVILPSGADSKIVGKISRRVSLVRYPTAEGLTDQNTKKPHKYFGSAFVSSSRLSSTPSRSSRKSSRGYPASTHSSRHRSSSSGLSEKSKPSRSKHISVPFGGSTGEEHNSTTPSGGSSRSPSSMITFSGSSDHLEEER